MNARSQLPPELLASVFSYAELGPNATFLVAVCRSWRLVAETFLYRSITVFDKATVKATQPQRTGTIHYYFLKRMDKKDGVYIDVSDEVVNTTSHRLELLCRTLAATDDRLARLVRELDFCANIPEMTFFLSLTSMCKNITHLHLRGPIAYKLQPEAVSIKNAIKEMTSLRLLVHDGVFPWFTVADVPHILASCTQMYSLSLRLTKWEPKEEYGFRSLEFPQLRELQFVPSAVYMERFNPDVFSSSFHASLDLIALSTLSLYNLTSFSALVTHDDTTLPPLKKCLTSWAQSLTHLSLHCNKKFQNGALDEILPNLTCLTELDCDHRTFSPRAILGMKSRLRRLDVASWPSHQIKQFTCGLEANSRRGGDPALPHLAFVKTKSIGNSRNPAVFEQRRLADVCHRRNIFVERAVQEESVRREWHSFGMELLNLES